VPRLALTDRFVAGVKSAQAPQTDYFDARTPGLAPRATKGGHKAWTRVCNGRTVMGAPMSCPALLDHCGLIVQPLIIGPQALGLLVRPVRVLGAPELFQ
jgi:hypothetical protein